MDAPGIIDVISAILIKMYNKKFKPIPMNLANGKHMTEIKQTTNPYIVTISITGPAKILDIQKVKEKLLNEYAMIGIINILADKVIEKQFIIYLNTLFSVIFKITLFLFLILLIIFLIFFL